MIIRMTVAGVLVLTAGGLGVAFLTNRPPAPVIVVEAPKPEPVVVAPAAKVAMLVAGPTAPGRHPRQGRGLRGAGSRA